MNGPLRTVIVDDEPLALRRLQIALEDIPDVEVVGSARDGAQALDLIRSADPDLVLLDIQMPGIDGVQLARALKPDHGPAVVFVTAFSRYATEAFEIEAVDYVLKPVEVERLAQAVARARRAIESEDAAARAQELRRLVDALRADAKSDPVGPRHETELWLAERDGRVRVPADRIDWIEAERDYVRVHVGARGYLLRDSLRALAERLDPAQFIRTHRSALVRIDAVARVVRRPAGGLALVLSNGQQAPVGRSYARALKARLRA